MKCFIISFFSFLFLDTIAFAQLPFVSSNNWDIQKKIRPEPNNKTLNELETTAVDKVLFPKSEDSSRRSIFSQVFPLSNMPSHYIAVTHVGFVDSSEQLLFALIKKEGSYKVLLRSEFPREKFCSTESDSWVSPETISIHNKEKIILYTCTKYDGGRGGSGDEIFLNALRITNEGFEVALKQEIFSDWHDHDNGTYEINTNLPLKHEANAWIFEGFKKYPFPHPVKIIYAWDGVKFVLSDKSEDDRPQSLCKQENIKKFRSRAKDEHKKGNSTVAYETLNHILETCVGDYGLKNRGWIVSDFSLYALKLKSYDPCRALIDLELAAKNSLSNKLQAALIHNKQLCNDDEINDKIIAMKTAEDLGFPKTCESGAIKTLALLKDSKYLPRNKNLDDQVLVIKKRCEAKVKPTLPNRIWNDFSEMEIPASNEKQKTSLAKYEQDTLKEVIFSLIPDQYESDPVRMKKAIETEIFGDTPDALFYTEKGRFHYILGAEQNRLNRADPGLDISAYREYSTVLLIDSIGKSYALIHNDRLYTSEDPKKIPSELGKFISEYLGQ